MNTSTSHTSQPTPPAEPTLRERTRRAVQAQLVEVAQRLFVEQGFESTTVDEIAAAAGISRSSFFRYFPGKEELVLSKYELTGQELARSLRDRPADEPLWTSLRHVLDHVVQYAATPDRAAAMLELNRVVTASPSLNGAYLARIDRIQQDLTTVARDRAHTAGHPWTDDDPAPRAIIGAAFACLHAAVTITNTTGTNDLGDAFDRAMNALHPLDESTNSH